MDHTNIIISMETLINMMRVLDILLRVTIRIPMKKIEMYEEFYGGITSIFKSMFQTKIILEDGTQ